MSAKIVELGRRWEDTGHGLQLVSGFTGKLLPGIKLRWDCRSRTWQLSRWGRLLWSGHLSTATVWFLRAEGA